jgi:hypothetical protein
LKLEVKSVALLDFIKNRNTSQQQSVANKSQEQKPETAKEMYAREASRDDTNRKPVNEIPEADKAAAKAAGERLDKATQHLRENAPSQPGDSGGSREAVRQNMTGQDKTVPALSPTSAQTGQPATEKPPSKEPQTPEKGRAQTMPRPRPSWER